MDAVYFHPDGYRHHFRNAEVKDGFADLRNDEGVLVYSNIPVSSSPKDGFCVLSGELPKPTKSKL